MGDFKAFGWFIGITIYFFLFLFIGGVLEIANVDDYIDVGGNDSGFCDSPRIGYNLEGTAYSVSRTSTRCIQTRVAFDQIGCGELNGCTWENESQFLFWTSDAGCYGDLNTSYYSNESVGIFTNICTLEGFQEEDPCHSLGCEWNLDSEQVEVSNTKTFMNMVGDLFTFRYDFGFTGLWNVLVNFIFFWLPFLGLLGCIYFMLPLVH